MNRKLVPVIVAVFIVAAVAVIGVKFYRKYQEEHRESDTVMDLVAFFSENRDVEYDMIQRR